MYTAAGERRKERGTKREGRRDEREGRSEERREKREVRGGKMFTIRSFESVKKARTSNNKRPGGSKMRP